MELETTDKDHEPIQFSEEFRRAKRNALLWSGIVILLSIGTVREAPTTGTNMIEVSSVARDQILLSIGNVSDAAAAETNVIEVGSVARNLAYSQATLIVLALVVLAFMAVGFVRADWRLGAYHSKFTVAEKLRDTATMAEKLFEAVKRHKDNITNADKSASNLADNMDSISPDFRKKLLAKVDDHAKSLIKYEKNQLIALGAEAKEPIDPGRALFIGEQLQKRAAEWAGEIKQDIEREIGKFEKSTEKVAATRSKVNQAETAIADTEEFTSTLAKNLESFSAKIVGRERKWHFWYDRVPVGVAVLLALGIACARLVSPDIMAPLVASESTQHQSSPGTQLGPPADESPPPPLPVGTATPAA